LKKKRRVTYDSEKEDAFIVHMNNNTLKFECNPKGLYTNKLSDEYLKKQSHLINTVKEDREGYTQRHFEQAKRAQELYHIVETPTIELFKTLIKMNGIKNCPMTAEDVNNAKKISEQTCQASEANQQDASLPRYRKTLLKYLKSSSRRIAR
jgi:hypothetical protein